MFVFKQFPISDCQSATFVGDVCGLAGLVLYSGGAKGVDTLSMNAALEARGSAVGSWMKPGNGNPPS